MLIPKLLHGLIFLFRVIDRYSLFELMYFHMIFPWAIVMSICYSPNTVCPIRCKKKKVSDLSMLLACLAWGGTWSCTHAKCVMAFSLSSSSIFLEY